MIRLHINVDHVATLRQARGTPYPDPVEAARWCEAAGADGITIHLREDRRHIQDHDVIRARQSIHTLLNLEMAATEEMTQIALQVRPDKVTLVPEKREEQTTEGGLDVVHQREVLAAVSRHLQSEGIGVSLFIDPERSQVEASAELRVEEIELHTGDYANAVDADDRARELDRLADAAAWRDAQGLPLHVAAGHGLTVVNVGALVRRVPQIRELNIGHAVVADAVFVGLKEAVRAFRAAMTVEGVDVR